ncbi:hypothetical protein Tco_0209704 [Tanacetum coccineum]
MQKALEGHGAAVSNEDVNHKFLRSLPRAWSNLEITMRTKPDVDTLSIDDLYNNLRVFEQELTSTSKSSASAQNVAFVSHSKNSTNKVKSGHTDAYNTYTHSNSSNNIPEREVPAGFADEVIYSLFAKQSEDLDLLHEDLEQIDDMDVEEMDINWQIAMIVIRMKKFYKKTGRRVRIDGNKPVGFDKKKLEYDGVVNWEEHTEEEVETNHALMATSSNNEANELYEKDEKLKKYRRIGMKAAKEKEQLQKTVDSWKDSSKTLWKLVDSGMSSTSKVRLGYEIKSNDEVLSYEEEMNRTVFNCTKEDYVDKPLYSRFSKTDTFKRVPHPLTGDYTPKPQQEIDESLYVYGKNRPQKPKTSVSDDTFSKNSVITNEKVVFEPKPTKAKPSCVTHVKTPRQPMKTQGTPKVNGKNWNEIMERELGEGYSFIKKKCFVCCSLSHLIRNYDFYEKKMAREAELKKQRGFNTGNEVAKPIWNNANRVNHDNHFVLRPVPLIVVRKNVNSNRSNINTGRANINSIRQNVNSVRSNVNTGSFNVNTIRTKQTVPISNSNSFSPVRPRVNKVNQRRNFSKSHSPVRRPIVRNTAKMTYSRADHLLKNMEDRGIFDSECSGHMTGNKDHLDDFEECKGGFVTFGGSKGYITDTLSVLGKFDGKCDEDFLVGYSLNSKAFRVYNLVTKKVEVNLHVNFLEEKPNVKGVGYRWVFDIGYLTDSMNYIPVSSKNQTNPHAGTSEVTNSAGTLQTPNANAFEEEDEAEELIVVPTAVRHTTSKVGPRKSFTNSKAEEFLTELQNLKTQEKEAYSTGISEDTPEILAFRRELDELAPKHLREVPTNKATSTTSVNSGSGSVNSQHADQDDSDMPDLTIFNEP